MSQPDAVQPSPLPIGVKIIACLAGALAAALLVCLTVLPLAGDSDTREMWERPEFAVPGVAAAALGVVSCVALLLRRDWGRKGLLLAAAMGGVICAAGALDETAPDWIRSSRDYPFLILMTAFQLLGVAVMCTIYYYLWRYLTGEKVRSAFKRG